MRAMKILMVDDDSKQCEVMKLILEDAGYFVKTVQSGNAALRELAKQQFDVVITDLMMGKMDGMELLGQIKQRGESCEVLFLTGYGSIPNAVEAMQKGAASYFIKSHGPEELLAELDRIRKIKRLENSREILEEQNCGRKYMLESKNKDFQRMLNVLARAANSSANILILGESGVGKEVLAGYTHRLSQRGENFLAVNCHALSENLIESELFGHEKGAFTGANEQHKGRFEAVDGGTLFLDEIGDIPLSTQAKLLRTLEMRKIERVGSNKSIDVDFKLISATNVDLPKAIAVGRFREDLYYRLCTITVIVPPLRDRTEDLPDLIQFFLEKCSQEMKKRVLPLPSEVMEALLTYRYPGNVRELRNIIERLVVLSDNGQVSLDELPDQFFEQHNGAADNSELAYSLKNVRMKAERAQILRVLAKTQNNVTQAAKLLGISSRQLFNKLNEYNIDNRDRLR